MAVNYDAVRDALLDRGLILGGDPLLADGRTHRYQVAGEDREKRGWYLLHEWTASDGSAYLVGSYGVWHGNDPGTEKVEIGKLTTLSAAEKAAFRARLADDKKRAIAQRQAQADRAARRAAAMWAKLPAVPEGEAAPAYLVEKQVRAHGLRYTAEGALVIPIADLRHGVVGLQFILPKGHPKRAKLGRSKTYWPAGLQVAGHCHLIGNPATSAVTLVAEGYATGATLYEATGLAVAVAFAANNLAPVAKALRKAYRNTRFLICADDDYLTNGNPGQSAASTAAMLCDGAWLAPEFPGDRDGAKLTDFNDLAAFPAGGLALVRSQVMDKIDALGWTAREVPAVAPAEGGGDRGLTPLLTLEEANARYSLIYAGKSTLFDHWEHCLVPKQDVLDVLPDSGWRDWKQLPGRKLVRLTEVGFDPTETDTRIKCNLWGGWPTTPAAGECQTLLDLLEYMCSDEPNARELFQWVERWLAYPIQHPGAKMHTALVFHGEQGVGKNLFFEAVMAIYGEYGRVIDQVAIEDKFNDWASAKLFLVCDEVVARMELYHTKNRLKGLITGSSIRINPKNVTPHEERNCVNLVFLSNEPQPVVLEKGDRRYCVVWLPPKLPPGIYDAVGDEIANGGIAALHQHLLDVDLGDFKPWTKPPLTRSKQQLIEVSQESAERFLAEWQAGELAWPFGPCASMDLYAAYRRWAGANGVAKPRESNHFLGRINKQRGWAVRPCHVWESDGGLAGKRSQKMVIPGEGALQAAGVAIRPEQKKIDYYSRHFFDFRSALDGDRY